MFVCFHFISSFNNYQKFIYNNDYIFCVKKTKFIQKISDPLPPKFYASKKTAIAKKKVVVPRSLTDTMTQWDEIFSDVALLFTFIMHLSFHEIYFEFPISIRKLKKCRIYKNRNATSDIISPIFQENLAPSQGNRQNQHSILLFFVKSKRFRTNSLKELLMVT